ncbi:MAG: hypothetical protein H3C54_04060 [Taibaiella sp.]|nr:hypothetical protein [Taibaiella sp.]
MLSIEGDASKNYFTFLYHSLYGKGLWFDGMNYSYGEHIVFTDAQPAFVIPLSYINSYLMLNPLAVINLLLVAGFFFAIIYVYKILLRMNVRPAWSIAAAVLIITMSPQQFKLSEHFSLAYFCVLTAVFYYNLVWYQTGKRKYVIALFCAALLFTFIHLYFALMIAMWVLLFSIGYVLFRKDSIKRKWGHTWPVLMAGILPLVLFRIFMLLTDTVTDRPAYPYGARAHGTAWGDITTSYLSPISKWLAQWIDTGTLSGGNEGYAYIGVVPLVIVVCELLYWIISLIQNRRFTVTADNNGTIIWIFMALCVLVFSSAIIFKKCFVCLDYASFIKQFRAIGRFSWMFYYIVTIVAVVVAHEWFNKLREEGKKITAYTFASVLLLLWVIEATPFANKAKARVSGAAVQYNQFYKTTKTDWQKLLSGSGYTEDSFRALYVLPYFHIGTEKLGQVPRSYGLMNTAFSTSLQLHLPLMNVMMSRNSWQQAFAQVKISGGPYTNKEVLRSDDKRPILIIHPIREQLNPDERYLLTSAKMLGCLNGNDVYALYADSLLDKEAGNRKEHKIFLNSMHQVDNCIIDVGPWYVEHYDTGTSDKVLMGKGAAKAIDGIKEIVFEAPLIPARDSQLYEFSAWMLVSNQDYKIGRFIIYLYDENDNLIAHKKILAQESVDNYSLWLRVSTYFEVPASCRKISVELVNVIYPSYLALDELMIRPADALIISKSSDSRRMVNNHILPY